MVTYAESESLISNLYFITKKIDQERLNVASDSALAFVAILAARKICGKTDRIPKTTYIHRSEKNEAETILANCLIKLFSRYNQGMLTQGPQSMPVVDAVLHAAKEDKSITLPDIVEQVPCALLANIICSINLPHIRLPKKEHMACFFSQRTSNNQRKRKPGGGHKIRNRTLDLGARKTAWKNASLG